MRGARRGALAVLTALLVLVGVPARAERVALTFDDLPALSLSPDPAYSELTTRRLVHGLARRRWPAIGFVVGGKWADQPARRDAMLRVWLRARLALGNHTWSHESLNLAGAPAYVADIGRTDALLRRLAGPADLRWFRHPYLETGPTEAPRQAVELWLAAHGYRVAPVTLENADDLFAGPYDEAIRTHDRPGAARLRAAYLAHTERCLGWYQAAARQLFGRQPDLVFLLHASRLNADALPGLAAALRRHGLTPAPLEQVMADPVYRLGDGPPTADGDDWLERWAALLHRDLPWDSFPEPPADVAEASRSLDPER